MGMVAAQNLYVSLSSALVASFGRVHKLLIVLAMLNSHVLCTAGAWPEKHDEGSNMAEGLV